MERTLCTAVVVMMLCAGCGDDESSNNANNASNADQNNANAQNQSTQRIWTAEVGGDLDVSITGGAVATIILGNTLQVNGADTDGSTLTIHIPFENELEATTYEPQLFNIVVGEPVYNCVHKPGLTVTLTKVEPVEGTFEGTITCTLRDDSTDMFDAETSGEFAETF